MIEKNIFRKSLDHIYLFLSKRVRRGGKCPGRREDTSQEKRRDERKEKRYFAILLIVGMARGCIFLGCLDIASFARVLGVIMIESLPCIRACAQKTAKRGTTRTDEIETERSLDGATFSYVTYCVHGGRVLVLEFFLILVVAALARRQSLLAATPALKR